MATGDAIPYRTFDELSSHTNDPLLVLRVCVAATLVDGLVAIKRAAYFRELVCHLGDTLPNVTLDHQVCTKSSNLMLDDLVAELTVQVQ